MPSTVKTGSDSTDIVYLQRLLTEKGFPCTADGIFGEKTREAVTKFQAAQGLTVDGIVGPLTWAELERGRQAPEPLPPILARIRNLGFEIPWRGDFHLFLFGIRKTKDQSASPNDPFDDLLGCAYTVNGLWRVRWWPATTNPGRYYLENPEHWFSPEGVAVMAPGQYLDAYRVGLHRGSLALIQDRPVRYYRDGDKDAQPTPDPANLKEGVIALNIHGPSQDSSDIGAQSAGCQVHAVGRGHYEMMILAKKQVDLLGIETFSYTLLVED
jgi:hypothetical protein